VETLLWYKTLGFQKKDFDDELSSARIEVIELSETLADSVTQNALKYRRAFPFKHHARDYIIGTTALENKATLITYNVDDFRWVAEEGGMLDTPENFLSSELK
jgi:predicted nucleic acid-binding protein